MLDIRGPRHPILFWHPRGALRRVLREVRPDVVAAGWSKDEWHGYEFVVSGLSAGTHEARVYALHSSRGGARYTLQMLGDPIRFEVNADGRWSRR